jgi:hypothetical protein
MTREDPALRTRINEHGKWFGQNLIDGIDKNVKSYSIPELKMPDILFPSIKVPLFNINGTFGTSPNTVPFIGLQGWHQLIHPKGYDEGGLFNKASIIQVGEKRPEFVGALDDLKNIFRTVMKENTSTTGRSPIIFNIDATGNNNTPDSIAREVKRLFQYELAGV